MILDLAIAVFLTLSPLVLHEMGHWMVLRRYGVEVREVWLGLGPKLYEAGWLRFGMLPIGGAVVPDPAAYAALAPMQRVWVALAGPLTSLAYGVVLLGIWLAAPDVVGVSALKLIAQLNFALALANIVPIPPLDGFHALSEWLAHRGRPLSPRTLNVATRLGNGMVYGIGFAILGTALLH